MANVESEMPNVRHRKLIELRRASIGSLRHICKCSLCKTGRWRLSFWETLPPLSESVGQGQRSLQVRAGLGILSQAGRFQIDETDKCEASQHPAQGQPAWSAKKGSSCPFCIFLLGKIDKWVSYLKLEMRTDDGATLIWIH